MRLALFLIGAALGSASGDPVGWWKLDDARDATAADASGNGQSGTLGGGAAWTPGQSGGALELDGTGFVRIKRTARLEAEKVSVCAWVRRKGDQAQWANVVRKTWKNNSGPTWTTWSLQLNPNQTGPDVVAFETGFSGANAVLSSTPGAILDGVWTHVAGVYDPASPSPQKKLYINGVLNSAQPETAALLHDASDTGDLYIGQNGREDEFFKGAVDDVRVYDRALSPEEVRALAAGAPAPPALKPDPRAAAYKPSAFAVAYAEASGPGAAALKTLQLSISFKIEAGPLEAALQAIERQTGLAFAFVPELFPAGLKTEALSHQGPAAEGLEKLLKPLDLRWDLGEFGGIVVLPRTVKIPSPDDWVTSVFDDTGLELLEPAEEDQRLGLKKGDLIVAVNGEKYPNARAVYRALRDAYDGGEAVVSVRRGQELLQIKTSRKDTWIQLQRGEDAPSVWQNYEKGGRRDSRWDGAFRKLCEESRKDVMNGDPSRVYAAARDCGRAGCRDPFLLTLTVDGANEFGNDHWNEMRGWVDVDALRTAYGGSQALARVRMAAEFCAHGSPAAREGCRRIVEGAWPVLRGGKNLRIRRQVGFAVASLHFIDGRYEACIRVMKDLRKQYAADGENREVKLQIQALLRLGRYADAAREHDAHYEGHEDAWHRTFQHLLRDSQTALEAKPELTKDRFEGPMGLFGWRTLSALDAIILHRGNGKPASGERKMEDMRGSYWFGYLIPIEPFAEEAEVHVFPRAIKTYSEGSGYVGVSFGAQPKDQKQKGLRQHDQFAGVQYNFMADLDLWRWHHDINSTTPIPMPGFCNDGSDQIRIYKTREVATVRCNGAWIATDAVPAQGVAGSMVMDVRYVKGSIDAGIFVPTKRCYDNDRIRELMLKINDPAATMTAEDALKLWDEASCLAPPDNFMKRMREWIPQPIRSKVAAPTYPADAPALEPLTAAAAEERLRQRGEARWVKPDATDPDLVWCARPDGVLESMSRVRYWTEKRAFLRDTAGAGVAVGEPVFDADGIWFPTDRGLFRYDRKAEVFRRIGLGDVLFSVPVKALASVEGKLRVETSSGASWVLDPRAGGGTR